MRVGLVASMLALAGCGRFAFDASADERADSSTFCGGHDEDADGVGDACDNCPADANADQRDLGERENGEEPDGVGDVCDPRPSVTGDRIALFVAFVESPFAQFETSPSVTWNDTDVLHLGDGTVAAQASFTAVQQFTRAAWRMRVLAVSPGETSYAGLWTHISNRSLADAVFSHVADGIGNGAPGELVLKEADGAGELFGYTAMTTELAAGNELVMIHDTTLATGGPERLHLAATGNPPLTCELAVTRPFTGDYLLEAVRLTADVYYVIVYATE